MKVSTRCAPAGFATDAHSTAAFVIQKVRRRLPRVSLATVYRTLRMRAAEGLLAERNDSGGLGFDGNNEHARTVLSDQAKQRLRGDFA